jgi:hypothetical protein
MGEVRPNSNIVEGCSDCGDLYEAVRSSGPPFFMVYLFSFIGNHLRYIESIGNPCAEY